MLMNNIILLMNVHVICILGDHGENTCSSSNCKNNKQLCKFQQTQNPARHCMDFEIIVKTDDDKKSILDKINSRRNKVASGEIRSFPSCGSMLKLEWNTKLELSAQRWANQCVKNRAPDIKDACRDFEGVSVGQNIATVYGESPGLKPTALVDIWYMELLNINGSVLPRYQESDEKGPHYDYFTQLVWSDTSEVGCGGVKFKERLQDSDVGRNRTVYRLVCNFAPSGNRRDESVYTSGSPCSKCPKDTTCDHVYTALCSKPTTRNFQKTSESTEKITIQPTSSLKETKSEQFTNGIEVPNIDDANTSNPAVALEDENYSPFDYFSHLHEFTKQTITLTTTAKNECKDAFAVDAFIDILRKKLSEDHMFKEMFFATKTTQGLVDNAFTDPSVAAFVNKIYSKVEQSTTTKSTESDLLNSTLLVDLVEAVIFRSGGKVTSSQVVELSRPVMTDVSPVKIQAELAQIQQNDDFTGHYFFPEDDDGSSTSETTEFYYDTPNLSIADVIMEIEDIKKSTVTKNFLDEILEMESSTDSTTTIMLLSPDDMNAHKSGHEVMKKFLEEIRDKSGRR